MIESKHMGKYINVSDYGVSNRLNRLMDEKCISGNRLADMLGISRSCIHRILNAESIPNTLVLIRLSKYFGVSTDYILFGKVDK